MHFWKVKKETMINGISMYLHHTKELKFRFFYIATSFISSICVVAWYFPEVVYISIKPLFFSSIDKLSIHHFLITSFVDVIYLFLYYIKFISIFTFLLVVPFHLLAFVKSGLKYNVYKRCKLVLKQSLVLFVISICAIHAFFLQNILTFFIFLNTTLLNTAFISMQPKLLEYMHFMYTINVMLFILFQLPIIINNIIFFNVSIFKRDIKLYRKYIYLGFLLFATLLTPPDVLSQLFFYFFYILMFECSFFIQLWTHKHTKHIVRSAH